MSNSESAVAEVLVSKWVAPEVGGDASAHKLVSEESIQRLRSAAQKEAHAKGYQAGLDSARADVQSRIELLDRLVKHLDRPLQQLEPDALDAMVTLATSVGRAIVNRELSIDRSLVLEAVQSALNVVADVDSKLRIIVNPQDLELLRATYADHDQQANLAFAGSSSIEPGGAIVESGATVIDAQLSSRITASLNALLNTEEPDES